MGLVFVATWMNKHAVPYLTDLIFNLNYNKTNYCTDIKIFINFAKKLFSKLLNRNFTILFSRTKNII